MGVIDKLVEKHVRGCLKDNLADYFAEALVERSLYRVEDILRKSFTADNDRPLTEIGFQWAWYFAITDIWPSVSKEEAADWLRDYMPEKFGSPHCDWTAETAKALANEFVAEYGESA